MAFNHDKKTSNRIYNELKRSAKRRGIYFNLTLSDINNLTFPITCPILGIPLRYNVSIAQDNSISIDRIDSSKGYEANNIIVISWRANKLKNDSTLNEMESLLKFYGDLGES